MRNKRNATSALESFEDEEPSSLDEASLAAVLVRNKPPIARVLGAT